MKCIKISIPEGQVRARAQMMPGCCGVALVYDVSFYIWRKNSSAGRNRLTYVESGQHYRYPQIKKLYKEFDKFIRTSPEPYDLNRARVVMADQHNGDIDRMVRYVGGWDIGKKIYNSKSYHYTYTYEHKRKVYIAVPIYDAQGHYIGNEWR